MKSKKDIDPIDDKGQLHGYQEWYNDMDKLWFRGYLKHLAKIGYSENHKGYKYERTEFNIR